MSASAAARTVLPPQDGYSGIANQDRKVISEGLYTWLLQHTVGSILAVAMLLSAMRDTTSYYDAFAGWGIWYYFAFHTLFYAVSVALLSFKRLRDYFNILDATEHERPGPIEQSKYFIGNTWLRLTATGGVQYTFNYTILIAAGCAVGYQYLGQANNLFNLQHFQKLGFLVTPVIAITIMLLKRFHQRRPRPLHAQISRALQPWQNIRLWQYTFQSVFQAIALTGGYPLAKYSISKNNALYRVGSGAISAYCVYAVSHMLLMLASMCAKRVDVSMRSRLWLRVVLSSVLAIAAPIVVLVCKLSHDQRYLPGMVALGVLFLFESCVAARYKKAKQPMAGQGQGAVGNYGTSTMNPVPLVRHLAEQGQGARGDYGATSTPAPRHSGPKRRRRPVASARGYAAAPQQTTKRFRRLVESYKGRGMPHMRAMKKVNAMFFFEGQAIAYMRSKGCNYQQAKAALERRMRTAIAHKKVPQSILEVSREETEHDPDTSAYFDKNSDEMISDMILRAIGGDVTPAEALNTAFHVPGDGVDVSDGSNIPGEGSALLSDSGAGGAAAGMG